MTSTGFVRYPEGHWPTSTDATPVVSTDPKISSIPGGLSEESYSEPCFKQRAGSREIPQQACPDPDATRKRKQHWPPRTCRICFETVNPTFHPPSENIPGLFQASPSVSYDPVPEAGRLLRPCQCKGSSKYVHEGCLQAWRHADPGYAKRNYWQCPTCGFRYRLERMQWGRWISSTATQIILTLFIFFLALFIMGFLADPIINLYVDPLSIISSAPLSKLRSKTKPILTDDDAPTWAEHFIKGLASLGLLGFVKVLFALGPWNWWNIRGSGIIRGGGQSGNTGRDRLANISWLVVIVGVCTFLWVGLSIAYQIM